MKNKKLQKVISFRLTEPELDEIEKMIQPPKTKSEFFRDRVQILILKNNK